MRFDTDMGKHGDTGDSELRVCRRSPTGRPTPARSGAPTLGVAREPGEPAVPGLEVQWRSADYYHCNFTALRRSTTERRRRWLRALLAMDYNDPMVRKAMDLEGVKRWLPGDEDGYYRRWPRRWRAGAARRREPPGV